MGILDKIGLGKRKFAAQKPKKAAAAKSGPAAEKTGAPKAAKLTAQNTRKSGDLGRTHLNLMRPIISEKAAMLSSEGKYVFAVAAKANKSEIRKSIESVYGVNVEGVNIINLSGKLRRQGRSLGKTSDWKKAIISLKKGEKIPGIIEAAQQ